MRKARVRIDAAHHICAVVFLHCPTMLHHVETIAAVMRADRDVASSGILARRDRIRLQRAKDLIAANLSEPLSVEGFAARQE